MASAKFYFDEHMSRKAYEQLIKRGYDIMMAVDVGMVSKHDTDEHLRYATEQDRIVVTFDREFIGLAFKRNDHAGVLGLSGNHNDVGYIVRTITEFVELYDPEKDAGKVHWF